MPKRSNEFQKLIKHIEKMLASEGASVIESLMLNDTITGSPREIDVGIRATVSGYPILVAIECRDHKRRADVTWIEQIATKYDSLPVNKVIAVSRGGFTNGAIKKAIAKRIDTIRLEDGGQADWKHILGDTANLRLQLLIPRMTSGTVEVIDDIGEPPNIDVQRATLVDRNGSTLGKVPDVLMSQFRSYAAKDAEKVIMEQGHCEAIKFWVRLPEGSALVDEKGNRFSASRLAYEGTVRYEDQTVSLKTAKYRGKPIAFGVADLDEKMIEFVLVQASPREFSFSYKVKDATGTSNSKSQKH